MPLISLNSRKQSDPSTTCGEADELEVYIAVNLPCISQEVVILKSAMVYVMQTTDSRTDQSRLPRTPGRLAKSEWTFHYQPS